MPQARRRRIRALIGAALVSASVGALVPVGEGVWAASAAAVGTCPGGGAPVDRFTDDDTSVHEAAIACTTWWELTRGVSATTYVPSRGVTRGQAATLVARLLSRTGKDLPASPPDAFPDDTGDAHSYAINRLAALDVVGGRADGRFASGAGLSRGAMASLLVNAYRVRTGLEPPRGGDHFSDDDGTVHEHAIDQAAELGLTLGSTSGQFDPWGRVSAGPGGQLRRPSARHVRRARAHRPLARPAPRRQPAGAGRWLRSAARDDQGARPGVGGALRVGRLRHPARLGRAGAGRLADHRRRWFGGRRRVCPASCHRRQLGDQQPGAWCRRGRRREGPGRTGGGGERRCARA